MLTITVLGPNNPHTDKLEKFARTAAEWVNPHMGYEIIRRADSAKITDSPALLIDGTIVSEGRVPASQYIVTWISDAVQNTLEEAAVSRDLPILTSVYDQAAR